MNKKFLLKGIISLYNSFNLNLNLYSNDHLLFNTTLISNVNNWFDMSYPNIYNLALLAQKVYFENDFNQTIDVSKDNDTVRAYLFSSEDYKTHIISIKGTTTILGKNINILNSVYNDKLNDNLFYSCCFYKQSSLFNKIEPLIQENCWESDFKNKTCKKKCFNVMKNYELNYIDITNSIIENIKSNIEYNVDFNNHEILFTGHSLGGTLAAIMGAIHNKPAISFESPGVENFLQNSNFLENKINYDNIYNFGHNADIIFTGKCNGRFSFCYIGGYNIDTKCHIGKVCEFDSINKLNISESIFTHKLDYVIKNIIPYWENDFPTCEIKNDCIDCDDWTYV